MLCERCQKRKANILYTEIINGIKREAQLCDECAGTSASFQMDNTLFGGEYSLGGLLSNILKGYTSSGPSMSEATVTDIRCKNCGLTYREFVQNGRFGCARCYIDFQNELDKSLGGIQGADIHTGKRIGQQSQGFSEIERLTAKLQEAIKKEEYEEAARLRDLIREKKKEDNNVG